MTLKKQKNRQHKEVVSDPKYRPKVVESKKRKEKQKKVPKNKLMDEAAEVLDAWIDGKLTSSRVPPWEDDDEDRSVEEELQEHETQE